ncbi:MAG: Mu-like prophage major head subunit gpT family protein, partial [Planctomycetaceae bacterium]|nr:Mu-like prophage major head subunit gpT family protein [Planctomycetaceae bacterium]
KATGEGDEELTPTFSMVAYTGGEMNIDGFQHPVVVDLTGLEIPSQNIPIRLDHKSSQGIGHTTSIRIENNELIAEGLISRDTDWARDVANSGTKGFPWKASIGGPIHEVEFIPYATRVAVNSHEFDGPIYLVREMTLKEISFVDNAADTNTSATVTASEKNSNRSRPKVNTSLNSASGYFVHTDNSGDTIPQRTTMQAGNRQALIPTPELLETRIIEDVQQRIRKATLAETNRIASIRGISKDEQGDLVDKAITEGWDVPRFELEFLRKSRPSVSNMRQEQNRPTNQVLEAVAMQSGGLTLQAMEKQYTEPVLEAAEKLRGIGFQEFCELACGGQLPRYKRDAIGWLEAAFSTTTLPGILSNIANKMLLEGYNYVDDTWRKICKFATVNDFKTHTRYRLTNDFKFQKIGDGGELKHGQIDEQKFTQKADTYGIMFALTRQMIINDDLSALTDIPRQIGMGAAESIMDAVWDLLHANPVQQDGLEFFHVGHKNYRAGADTVLNIDGLTKAEVTFMEQTKPNGRPLGVPASILLVPTSLKVVAEMLMKSTFVNETTKENEPKPNQNPHAGKFEVVSTTYLSSPSVKGSSAKAWYLFADPNRMPAFEVAFLGGQDSPTIERADADFNVLGVQFRGYIDFGVREQDWRGVLKMKGEA